MNFTHALFAICLALLITLGHQVQAEFHLDIGDLCIASSDPGKCMASYGFKCHRIGRPEQSLKAYSLGCNLALPNSQSHFVQMLNNNDTWHIEVQKTSTPDTVVLQDPTLDSDTAVSDYVQNAMNGYRISSNGSVPLTNSSATLNYAAGHSRNSGQVTVRSVCAVLYDGLLKDKLRVDTQSKCEELVLRAIKIRSQFTEQSPYFAPGAGSVKWEHTTLGLVSGATALVFDGRHTYSSEDIPCRWLPECCSKEGALYLDSCRTPSQQELNAVENCLAEDHMLRSEPYFDCLDDNKVKVGCENKPDGSRLCF